MNKDKYLKKQLKKIFNALLDFEEFPLSNQVEFINACSVANARLPIIPAIQVIIDRSELPFKNITTAYMGKRIDVTGGNAIVEAFNEVRVGVPSRIDLIKSLVKGLMPNNKVVLIALKLYTVTPYHNMSQADLLATVREMLTTANTYIELTTVWPLMISLVDDINDPLSAKTQQFINITSDRKNMIKIVEAAQNCLIANFGSFLTLFSEKLEVIIEYLPIQILYNNVHAPGYLTKNQELIEKPIIPIVHISKLRATKGCWVKIENFGSKPMRVWRSINVSTVCPKDAPTIGANSNGTFRGSEMGVDKAYCLMAEFTEPLDMVKAKFSIRRKK